MKEYIKGNLSINSQKNLKLILFQPLSKREIYSILKVNHFWEFL